MSSNIETAYLETVRRILREGKLKENRTGVPALTIPPIMLQHDMASGFPLITTRKIPFRTMSVETEAFIKGITDKHWLQERGCHIWDEWCNPQIVPYKNDGETKKKMSAETDLGLIYGYQWRNFNSQNIDQFRYIVETLKTDPSNRRLVCSAWNPAQLERMALPPCHVLFHVTVIDRALHLSWFQRSCDMMLGVPFNIASYALIASLIAKETGLVPGTVTGFLSDVHIYQNHIRGAEEQIGRTPRSLPRLEFISFDSIYTWTYDQCRVAGYTPYDAIPFPIAV